MLQQDIESLFHDTVLSLQNDTLDLEDCLHSDMHSTSPPPQSPLRTTNPRHLLDYAVTLLLKLSRFFLFFGCQVIYIDDSIPPVNTHDWLDWGEWAECNSTGFTNRYRSCPHPEYGGVRNCVGDKVQAKSCFFHIRSRALNLVLDASLDGDTWEPTGVLGYNEQHEMNSELNNQRWLWDDGMIRSKDNCQVLTLNVGSLGFGVNGGSGAVYLSDNNGNWEQKWVPTSTGQIKSSGDNTYNNICLDASGGRGLSPASVCNGQSSQQFDITDATLMDTEHC